MASGDHPTAAKKSVLPWLRRREWAARRIIFSAGVYAAQAVAVTIFVDLVSLVVLWIIWNHVFRKGNWWTLFGLVLPAIGVGLTFQAIAEVRRWRAFGSSVFEMASVPGVIGGRLVGVIRISKRVQPESGFHLALSCFVARGDGFKDSIRWHDEQTIARDLLPDDPETSEIPVSFQIPYDCAPTDEDGKWYGTCWRLEATAKTAGPEYRAEFEVPVFKTPESDPGIVADRDLAADCVSPEKLESDLREAGVVKMASPTDEGCRLVFSMGRTPLLATLVTLTGLLFGGAPFVVCFVLPAETWPFYLGAFVIFGGLGLLILVAAGDLWFFRSTVDVSPSGLTVIAGWFGPGRSHNISDSDIVRIETKMAATMWRKVVYYDIVAVCANRKVTLGKRVPGKRLAESVCHQIDRARTNV